MSVNVILRKIIYILSYNENYLNFTAFLRFISTIFMSANNNILHRFPGKPYGDDNNDLYNNEDYTDPDGIGEHGGQQDENRPDESVIYKLPKFVTKPQNLMVNEGSTIRLPCVVDRLGKT